MAMTRITGHGLATIGILVAILWGCLFAERSIIRKAQVQQYRALRDIRTMQLRKGLQPASTPVKPIAPSRGPAVG